MTIAILGRQPKLGLAELESLYGADAVQPFGVHAAKVEAKPVLPRLGGTLKLATPITELPTTDWRKLTQHIAQHLPHHLAKLPEGKVKLGLSVYGIPVGAQQLLRSGLELKKVCRAAGRSVRLVPNSAPALNSAQVAHNQLTGELGLELLFIKNGNSTLIAKTSAVQNVDEYASRDHGRPKRDAFVGMLPPKLAQIMLNMAGVQPGQPVLDPFCGTGVVLQEATLLGAKPAGTDISQKMIDYSRANLAWLAQKHDIGTVPLEVADATAHTWPSPIGHIVCEAYLGQPLSGLPKPHKLDEIVSTCNTITAKFLQNARSQLEPGTRHCVAVPAWRVGKTFRHVPLLDDLNKLGYNRVRFQHARWEDLLYHREDQIVARELLVVTAE